MKLVAFQPIDAVRDLFQKGYLECDEAKINIPKVGVIYDWVSEKMNERIKNDFKVIYPMWCWVKCNNRICPPKRKGEPVPWYDVKITFHKDKKDVFITDFRRYSFLLNNIYIPDSLEDKRRFDEKLKQANITIEDLKAYVRHDKYQNHRTDKEYLDICAEIRKSFDKCITEDSDILQGCVWRISLSDIESIEILNDKTYRYGSLNFVRSSGDRIDWQEDYYRLLKKQ